MHEGGSKQKGQQFEVCNKTSATISIYSATSVAIESTDLRQAQMLDKTTG